MAPKNKMKRNRSSNHKRKGNSKFSRNSKNKHITGKRKYSENSKGITHEKRRYSENSISDIKRQPHSSQSVVEDVHISKRLKLTPADPATELENENTQLDVCSDESSDDVEFMLYHLRKSVMENKKIRDENDAEASADGQGVLSEDTDLMPPNIICSGSETESNAVNPDNEIDLFVKEEDGTNICNVSDPFEKHFTNVLHPNFLKSVQEVSLQRKKNTDSWPLIGKFLVDIPTYSEEEPQEKVSEKKKVLEDEVCYAEKGGFPKLYDLKTITPEEMFIKPHIIKNILNNVKTNSGNNFLTPLQNEIYSILCNYQDLYYAKRDTKNSDEIRFTYCLHLINHVLKTNSKILLHNSLISKSNEVDKYEDKYRDQGYVRPKVLVLVPFKDHAHKIVGDLEKLLFSGKSGNVSNRKRFEEEFTGNEIGTTYKNPKPDDFISTFSGNISEDFRIGLAVTKKSLKLFVEFYSADIIIASPLGLRRIIGGPGEPNRDFDFLASIELLILDQAELLSMQNWLNVLHIFKHLHILPKKLHETDLSRARMWTLDGHSKFYRQTIILSNIILPEIMSLFNNKCFNYAGRIKVMPEYEYGSISWVSNHTTHSYYRFSCDTRQEEFEKRFEFFKDSILPNLENQKQIVVFIPSYLDFIKMRNHFKKNSLSFTEICEYTSPDYVARARDVLFNNGIHYMLYTERFHFYNRIKLRGIRHLLFYQPPKCPHFYSEMCNFLCIENVARSERSDTNFKVSVIYSKYDIYQLRAIVGEERASDLISSPRDAHRFFC